MLGWEVATELFRGENPLGKEIKIPRERGGFRRWQAGSRQKLAERFTVVGVMDKRGRSLRFGWNLDNIVFLPLTTLQERFTGERL